MCGCIVPYSLNISWANIFEVEPVFLVKEKFVIKFVRWLHNRTKSQHILHVINFRLNIWRINFRWSQKIILAGKYLGYMVTCFLSASHIIVCAGQQVAYLIKFQKFRVAIATYLIITPVK